MENIKDLFEISKNMDKQYLRYTEKIEDQKERIKVRLDRLIDDMTKGTME